MILDSESLRLVLDAAYESIVAKHPDPASPIRLALEEVARAVGWRWYPEPVPLSSEK